MDSVTTIIVTYNNAATLRECLEAAKNADTKQALIVDNNSADESAAIAASLGAHVIKNAQNLGFATAANQAAAQAQTPYLLFLNPDAQLHPSAVSAAVAYFEKHPEAAIAGLALTDPATNRIESASFGKFPTLWHLFTRKLAKQKPLGKDATPVDWVSGGALVIRQSVWEQVKGFDTGFFLYWEDVDLCRRVKNSKYKIVILPTAVCYHQRGASLSNKRAKARLYDAGADRYFRKHYPGIIWGIQHYLRRLYRLVRPYSR